MGDTTRPSTVPSDGSDSIFNTAAEHQYGKMSREELIMTCEAYKTALVILTKELKKTRELIKSWRHLMEQVTKVRASERL